jgi:hypothetical protein
LRATAAWFAALFAVLIAAVPAGCAPRRAETERTDLIAVTIRVVNNLSEPLDVAATQNGVELWSGRAGASSSAQGQLGALVAGSKVSLRARNLSGAISVRRDSVTVMRSELVWVIP